MKSLNELQTVDQSLATNKAFIQRLSHIQQAQQAIDAEWQSLKEAMQKSNVKALKGDWGSIQFVPRPYYQIDGHVAPRFLRQAVDGEEVKLWMRKHDGVAPKGVIVKSSNVFRKSLK